MPWLAAALLTVFLLVVFPLRAALRRRRHGSAGRPDWRAGRPRRWLIADVLFVGGFAALLLGPVLEGMGAIDAALETGTAAAVFGVGLIVAATALAVWSQETMGAAWRPDMPPAASSGLVTVGPFGLVRNPNYVAMLTAGAGVALLAPNVVVLLSWIVVLVSLMLTARIEEPMLAEVYGAPYRRYASRVGRFIPGVGRLTERSHSV